MDASLTKSSPPEKSSPNSRNGQNNGHSREKPRLKKKITARYLENSGAYYLQRFAASTRHFRQVMQRKIDLSCRDHPDQNKESCYALLDELVTKFQNLGYLNDDDYARALLYSLSQRGYSAKRIMLTMGQKGLPKDVIDQHLPDDFKTNDLSRAVRFAKKKKIGPFSPHPEENLQRALGAFARAGFEYELSRRVLDMSLDDAMEILEQES